MSTTRTLSQQNFDWMILAGVGVDDVKWLSQMSNSLELHSPVYRVRVEEIYSRAISGVLESATPVDLMQKIVAH